MVGPLGYLRVLLPPESSTMKSILLTLSLLLITQQMKLGTGLESHDYDGMIISGTTDEFKQYNKNTVYVDVDISQFTFR